MLQSAWSEKVLDLQGLIMKPVSFNTAKITLMDAVIACHEAGWQVAEHRHPWYEFNYVTEGSMHTRIGDTGFETEKGAFLILPPGVMHSNQNMNDRHDDGFCLRFQIERLQPSLQKQAGEDSFDQLFQVLAMVRPYSTRDRIVDEIIDDLFGKQGYMSQQLTFIRLVVRLFEVWNKEAPAVKDKYSRNEALVWQAIFFLSEYYQNQITVGDLANALHVSYRHLARVFRQVAGVTVIEKLNDIRINKAKELLLETDEPVRTISQTVGFENEFYFSRLFSQYTFSTPTEFRRKFKK